MFARAQFAAAVTVVVAAATVVAVVALAAPPAAAQWDPTAGLWLKESPSDLRVMTFNVRDGLCSSNDKSEGPGNWCALARLVAALKPDVLLLQEAGDNEGNGTGPTGDSESALAATLGLFLHGGLDTFHPGAPAVGAFVRLYDPELDLPFVAVSGETDGFNRNAILSRYPFADLNGDGAALLGDMPPLAPDDWAPGGGGGIRGWGLAEIDLPDGTYAGDLVVGNSHLKSGTAASSHDQRIVAAKNIAWCIQYWFNGIGGVPDPHDALFDQPPAGSVLGPDTPLITAGDWNEDEAKNGDVKGPAAWIAAAAAADGPDPGGDGPDRDGTDLALDDARDVFTGSPSTIFGNKYDVVAWQDSIATLRRAFVFSTASLPADGSATPPELLGMPGGFAGASYAASDHRPIVADFILPAAGCRQGEYVGGGKAGSSGTIPRFTMCGGLGPGQEAIFVLSGAPPAVVAVPVLGFGVERQPFAGGSLLPSPPMPLPGLMTNARGRVWVRIAGGGGPLHLVVQWVVLDAKASYGKSLSNAMAVTWPP